MTDGNEYRKLYRLKNALKLKLYKKEWNRKNPNYQKIYYKKNRERILNQIYARNKKNRKAWLAYRRNYDHVYKIMLKKEALEHYSKGKPKCACCGYDNFTFLTIDHIKPYRKGQKKRTGRCLIHYLRKRHYPKGYQVLCFNCNCAKWIYKQCPHKSEVMV